MVMQSRSRVDLEKHAPALGERSRRIVRHEIDAGKAAAELARDAPERARRRLTYEVRDRLVVDGAKLRAELRRRRQVAHDALFARARAALERKALRAQRRHGRPA